MRSLLAKDIAPVMKILSKMEIKETIKRMFAETTNKRQSSDGEQPDEKEENGRLVSELVWGIVENYYKAESELFAFLGSLENKTVDEIANLPLPEFINLITALISKENLPFFKLVAK